MKHTTEIISSFVDLEQTGINYLFATPVTPVLFGYRFRFSVRSRSRFGSRYRSRVGSRVRSRLRFKFGSVVVRWGGRWGGTA